MDLPEPPPLLSKACPKQFSHDQGARSPSLSPSFIRTLLVHKLAWQDCTAEEQDGRFLPSLHSHVAHYPPEVLGLLDKDGWDDCDQCSEDDKFRFITSMVSHQVPFMESVDHYNQSELIMSMVAHMFYKIIGKPQSEDQNKLREEYIEYIEEYVNEDLNEDDQFCFLTSFVSHCLPFMDCETQPIFSELLTSMTSHRCGPGTVSTTPCSLSPCSVSSSSRYSTDSSSLARAEIQDWANDSDGYLSARSAMETQSSEKESKSCPDSSPVFLTNILKDQRESWTGSDSTPESMKSLEPVPTYPVRHLLSNFTEKQLDIDFCEPLECSLCIPSYDNTPGDSLSPLTDFRSSRSGSLLSENGYYGSKEQSASPTYIVEPSESEVSDTWVLEDRDITITEVDSESFEFEPRHLSIVHEETEYSDSEETEETDTIEEVVTATCTIGIDTPIKIETLVERSMKDKKIKECQENEDVQEMRKDVATLKEKKHVSFVNGEPAIINADSDNLESEIEEVVEPSEAVKIQDPKTEYISSQEAKTSRNMDNPKKAQYRVRFQMKVGSDEGPKEKKSLFNIVLGWFGKYI